MDPFTHLLLGYLITFGIWGPNGLQYVFAGAIAGALPDADVVFFPISRWVPLLRHRGISHSIVGVTAMAVAGAFLTPYVLAYFFGSGFSAGSPLLYFIAWEAGGLSHVLLDALDHWAVPIFSPFSHVEYHFDADRIVNLGAMIFTGVSYGVLLYERGRVPVILWELTSWVLLLLAALYIGIRLLVRWRIGAVRRRDGFTDVVPQANPLEFLLVQEALGPGQVRMRFARYHLRRGYLTPPRLLEVTGGSAVTGPVQNRAQALDRSYAPALKEAWTLGETHRFAEVIDLPSGFEVFWYSLEFTFFGRAAGVVAKVDSTTGDVVTRSVWRSPAQRL
jgi:membrane-bound metal-dependent hydrolase YbcI (DUF457 family)